MRVLVIGGTGTVGRTVVECLQRAGHQARVMTRSPERAGQLPPGAESAIADLDRPETLKGAFAGTDGTFLLAALSPSETAQGLNAVEAAQEAGAGRLVYMSVVAPPGSDVIPHFASKLPIEHAVRSCGLPWTILRPNHFFQNDLRHREAISAGIYPEPIGSRGLNRVDVRDIADAAVNAFARGVGGIVPLNGPRGLTGDDTARVYTEQFGKPVRYAGDDLDAWEARARKALPAWMVRDLRIMYDFFIRNGAHASGRDFAAQEELLGRAPRSFEAFVAELAEAWKAGR